VDAPKECVSSPKIMIMDGVPFTRNMVPDICSATKLIHSYLRMLRNAHKACA